MANHRVWHALSPTFSKLGRCALIIFAAAIVGGVAGSLAGRGGRPVLGVLAFLGGAVAACLVVSYLLYGR